jgi:hypothetical protein
MTERERLQERARRRRRRHPTTGQPPRLTGAQHLESSMLSAPSTIPNNSAITLRPAFAAHGPAAPQPHQPARQPSIPKRLASVATSITAASDTARWSSKSTLRPSSPTGSSSCTLKGDLLSAGPGCSDQPLKPCAGGHSSIRPGRNQTSAAGDPGLGFRRGACG